MTAAKPLLYGIVCCVGSIGLAVLVGAVGAECLWRYIEERR